MSDENGGRRRGGGVEFGPLKRALREHQYPVSVAELVEQYGGFELGTATGGERLESALRECERTRFHEPREVRDAILDAVGEATVPGGDRATARSDEARRDGPAGAGDENGDGASDWSRLST